MKYLFLLIISVTLFASSVETKLYSGYVEIGKDNGHYYGAIIKNKSEDETLSFEIGMKSVQIRDMNYSQSETYIALEREISYDSKIKFSYLNIDEDTYGGNLYALSFINSLENGMELNVGGGFLNYKLDDVYQFDFSIKDFLGDSPFYYRAKYNINQIADTDKTRYYNSLDTEVGFIYAKYQGYISTFFGKKRYALQDEDCFSWNIGNLHEKGFRTSFMYQITINTLIKIDYLHTSMLRIDNIKSNLNVYNFVITHRF